ncbi:MAG: hypothetical protein Q4C48_06470 [Lachnospiraceae bacterium]|nr:hypothetical protein [Lachnospiraceae bacterium]
MRKMLLLTALIAICFIGCDSKETEKQPYAATPVPTLSIEAEAPSPSASAAPSSSPEATPSGTPIATPTPEFTVTAYEEENGEIRMEVTSYDPQTGCTCYKTYLDGVLVTVLEITQDRVFGQKDYANITKSIQYLNGKEQSRMEERDIYSFNGKLLEHLETVNGLYYYRGEEHVYKDGLRTDYFAYLKNHEAVEHEITEYDEKGQLVHAKLTHVQNNHVLAEVFWEYYENGNVKLERRTEPAPYLHTYYENGEPHIKKGYTEGGNWYHYEYNEDGGYYEYDEDGNLIDTVLKEPDEEGE